MAVKILLLDEHGHLMTERSIKVDHVPDVILWNGKTFVLRNVWLGTTERSWEYRLGEMLLLPDPDEDTGH